jgi:hypothetical protein
VADAIKGSGRMGSKISASEALAILWAMTGSDRYSQFVFQTGWTPDPYEEWLGVALINLLLQPADDGASATRP